jgi:protein-disulfide isomerase
MRASPLSRSLRAALLAAGSIGAGVALAWTAPLSAEEFSGKQKSDIEKIVHDYLLSNPEVIRDAIDELQKRDKVAEAASREKVVNELGDKILHSPNQAVVGNPNGDVTLVEFFDYNCGYCKQSLATITKLIEGDSKLRVVLKDFPILGADSVEAAQIATAARMQLDSQKFWDFHRKLLSTRGHIGKQQALAAAKEAGADMARLEKDLAKPEVQAALKEVATLADQLRFDGTPSWIIGKEAIVGGLPLAQLKAKIDNIRKCGKSVC